MGASIFAVKRGGTVVTCAATSGYMVEFDNRHFWMKLKQLISSHFANYAEAWAANRLIDQGRIHPVLSASRTRSTASARPPARAPQRADGKLGVLCLAPAEGLGIDRPREARTDRRGQHHPLPPAPDSPARRRHAASVQRLAIERVEWRMLLTEIDHVAIAVRDLDAAIEYYAKAFGATVAHREIVERDGVEEALIKVADSYIQLTAATRDDSPIAKAIEKRGEGLHHVGYRVDDCAAALAAMVAAGATPIDTGAAPGQPRHDRRLRPSQGQLRNADRARAGVTCAGADAEPGAGGCPVGHGRHAGRHRAVLDGGRARARRVVRRRVARAPRQGGGRVRSDRLGGVHPRARRRAARAGARSSSICSTA